jgi:hypothetical protein
LHEKFSFVGFLIEISEGWKIVCGFFLARKFVEGDETYQSNAGIKAQAGTNAKMIS